MDKLIQDMLQHLQGIQMSRKGGAPNNLYLPQLRVDLVDELADRVAARLATAPTPFVHTGNFFDSDTESEEENVR